MVLQQLERFLKRFLPPCADTFHAFVLDWEARTQEERAQAKKLEELLLRAATDAQEVLVRIAGLQAQLQGLEVRTGELNQRICALVSHAEEWERAIVELRAGTQGIAERGQENADCLRALTGQAQKIDNLTQVARAELAGVREQLYSMTLYSENRPWNEQISLMLEVWLGAERLHSASFAGYHDKYLGRDIVLCGAGPTLNYYVPNHKDAVYIALNRAFLHSAISFDYIFSADWRGIYPIQNQLAAYQGNHCVKLLARQTYSVHETGFPDEFIARCGAVSFYGDDYRTSFTRDVMNEPLRTTFTSALSALQLVLYTHPKRIYLVGIDMSDGHFNDPEGKGEVMWWSVNGQLAPDVMRLWQDFKGFAQAYYPDTEIISVNPVRLKGLFKDEYTDSYLKTLK